MLSPGFILLIDPIFVDKPNNGFQQKVAGNQLDLLSTARLASKAIAEVMRSEVINSKTRLRSTNSLGNTATDGFSRKISAPARFVIDKRCYVSLGNVNMFGKTSVYDQNET